MKNGVEYNTVECVICGYTKKIYINRHWKRNKQSQQIQNDNK